MDKLKLPPQAYIFSSKKGKSLREFDDTQPRDEDGKWTDGDGGGDASDADNHGTGLDASLVKLKPSKDRAFEGKQKPVKTKLTKQEAGALGEAVVISYLRSAGVPDAQALNLEANNFPVDLVGDHQLVEVKTGLVSNGPSAQQWRATIGQPGIKETEWLKKASAEEKRKWNARKQAAIIARKQKVVRDYSKKLGTKIKPYTMTTIINPDTKTVDVYRFKGFHSRIAWRSDEAKKAYVGSFKYA